MAEPAGAKRRISRGIEDLSAVSIPGSWGHVGPVRSREGNRAGGHVISVLGPTSNRLAMWGLGCFAIRDGGFGTPAERPPVRIDADGCLRRVLERSFIENKRDIRLGGEKASQVAPKKQCQIRTKTRQILPKSCQKLAKGAKKWQKNRVLGVGIRLN